MNILNQGEITRVSSVGIWSKSWHPGPSTLQYNIFEESEFWRS